MRRPQTPIEPPDTSLALIATAISAGLVEGAATGGVTVGAIERHDGEALVEHAAALDQLVIYDDEGHHLRYLHTGVQNSVLSVTDEGEVYLEDSPVDLETLAAVLAQFKAESPEAKIELKADEKTDLGTLVQIWDAITKSGFKIKDVPARLQVTPQNP